MQFDRASKQVTATFGEAKRFAVYLPFFGVVFGAGVAWATAKADLGAKADKIKVDQVDDSLGRAVVYQAGRLDRLEAALQTLVTENSENRLDTKAMLTLLCENFPGQQTRLVQLRCQTR